MESRQGEDHAATKGFEDLRAWQLTRRLMLECHELSDTLPAIERYDLSQQIRRASKSAMANIAEGYGRYHYLDSLRFFYIARGSINETINHIITAHDLRYAEDSSFERLYALGREAERALNGYIAYVGDSNKAVLSTAVVASQKRVISHIPWKRSCHRKANGLGVPCLLIPCFLVYSDPRS